MHDEKLVIRQAKFASNRVARSQFRGRHKKIPDNLDRSLELKSGDRFLPQTFGDGRDRIGVRERVLDRWPITRILSEQSRIRAVQGGDDLRRVRRRAPSIWTAR